MHLGENASSQSAYLTTRGFAVTLTFDLLTSKSNQLIFLSNCTEVVDLVKLPQAVYKISCLQALTMIACAHARTHIRVQPENRKPLAPF